MSLLQLNFLLDSAQFAMLFHGTHISVLLLYIMHVFNQHLFLFIIDNLAAAPDEDNEGARLLLVEDDDNPSA